MEETIFYSQIGPYWKKMFKFQKEHGSYKEIRCQVTVQFFQELFFSGIQELL